MTDRKSPWNRLHKRLSRQRQEPEITLSADGEVAQHVAAAIARKDWIGALASWRTAIAQATSHNRPALYLAAFRSFCGGENPALGRMLLEEGFRRHPSDARLLAAYATSENLIAATGRESRHKEMATLPHVDIVICAHNALPDLEQCLESIFLQTKSPYTLTIVDDNSDDPLKTFVDQLATTRPWMRVFHNAKNLGYTKSANLGLRAARSEWVLLLNSDTIVTRGWLEGLLECASTDSAIRAVGPLSNAATLQSIPGMLDANGEFTNNRLPQDLSPDDMGEILRHVTTRSFPRVAVLNGFCLLLHKPTVTDIGLFDEVRFPRGYGEENDLCLRLARAGHKLAIADHVYVYHAKTRSFSEEERRRLIRKAGKTLRELWTGYSYRFIADSVADLDSMIALRAALKHQLSEASLTRHRETNYDQIGGDRDA